MAKGFKYSPLRLRLFVAIISSVILISAMAMAFEYRYQHRIYLKQTHAALEEQARTLLLARSRISDSTEFAEYVDALCAQMNDYISPGHHVLVLDPNGLVSVRSRHHSGKEVEEVEH